MWDWQDCVVLVWDPLCLSPHLSALSLRSLSLLWSLTSPQYQFSVQHLSPVSTLAMTSRQPQVVIINGNHQDKTVTFNSEKVLICYGIKRLIYENNFIRNSIMTTYRECIWDPGELLMMRILNILVRKLMINKLWRTGWNRKDRSHRW